MAEAFVDGGEGMYVSCLMSFHGGFRLLQVHDLLPVSTFACVAKKGGHRG